MGTYCEVWHSSKKNKNSSHSSLKNQHIYMEQLDRHDEQLTMITLLEVLLKGSLIPQHRKAFRGHKD